MKKISFLVLIFIFFCSVLTAQSAEKVTMMIESQTVTISDIAYFAATYFGISEDEAESENALEALEEYVQFPKIDDKNASLTYEDFAYFCTQVWNIEGGIMLRLTKSPRYSFRELQSMGIIENGIQQKTLISGVEALTLMTKCIDFSVENETINFDSFSTNAAN